MYFNARWYDADTGRFVTEDPVRDGLLWYAYANNNPMKFTDPTGLRAAHGSSKSNEEETRKADEKNSGSGSGSNGSGSEDSSNNQRNTDTGNKEEKEKRRKEYLEEYAKAQNRYGIKDKFDSTIFTREEIMSQLDLDKRFAFSLGIKRDSMSCQTAAMINAYIITSQNGVKGSDITAAVSAAIENGALAADGSPNLLNTLSETIASTLGVQTIDPVLVFDKDGLKKAPVGEARNSKYSLGILESRNDILRKSHHTLVEKDSYGFVTEFDSLPPDRPEKQGYSATSVLYLD